jgi:hypothetical protein
MSSTHAVERLRYPRFSACQCAYNAANFRAQKDSHHRPVREGTPSPCPPSESRLYLCCAAMSEIAIYRQLIQGLLLSPRLK